MNRYSKLPARFLLVLLGTILIAAAMTSVSLANTTEFESGYFDVVEARSTYAWFSITRECDDKDENCAVKVEGTPGGAGTDYTARWVNELADTPQALGGTAPTACDSPDGDDRYERFENCWETVKGAGNFTVEWPVINPGDDFEITPYCKRGDSVCAEELRVCFNADDCDGNSFSHKDWTQMGELWDEAGSCLYDHDEDDVWECIDDALDDWLDDNMRSGDDYNDLEDEEDDTRGFTLEDYENDLDDVGDQPYTRRTPRRQPTPVPPAPVYQPPTYQPSHPPAQPRHSGTLYLDAVYVNYGGYLDTASGFGECNTAQGCISVIGSGTGMSGHLGRVFIQITDPQTRSCLSAQGIPYSGPTVMEFDDPVLQACDSRIATANGACPTRGIGVKEELLRMYNLGLLRGLLSPAHAQVLRSEVDSARRQAADCLCRSGFSNRDFVSVATGNPWDYNADTRQPLLCRS
ncbi:MAG: hypothetical protein F4Y08_16585 [Caldilineaceae bacterium SB0662_bin_9]|uniref:Uncharacterized protein n=1 Tax=Caldilineaceae bacterium SB0662_bin_9 TaxID=2605258 RepID=A0A6B1DW53_9CHLR|nr:hypothetical protein [Caldilineaceae bacterium SB0662_bin_9]